MYKRKDDGVSPVIAAILIIGLIAILVAVVGPVAINTITEFAVQEKSTVGVTVKISSDDQMQVNIVNGKDYNELKSFDVSVYYKNKKPQESGSISFSSSGGTYETPIDTNDAAYVIVVGSFADGHSEIIFSGTIQPGYIVVPEKDLGTCLVIYKIGTDEIHREYLFTIGKNPAFYVPDRLPSGAPASAGIIWYEDEECTKPWTRLTNTGDVDKTLTLYGEYVANKRTIIIEYLLEPLSGTEKGHETISYLAEAGMSDNDILTSDAFLNVVRANIPVGFEIVDDTLTITGDKVVINCNRLRYQVKYEITGDIKPEGTNEDPNSDTYTKTAVKYGTIVPICPNLTATGTDAAYYVFSGWSSRSISAEEMKKGEFTVTKSVIFTGSWTKKDKLTVIFNNKGHGGTAPSQVQVPYGSTLSGYSSVVNWPTAAVTGYTFNGWYNNPAAADTNSVLNWETEFGWRKWNFTTDQVIENTNLYANWIADVYKIQYHDVTDSSTYAQEHTYGTETRLPIPAESRTGKYFGGWKDAKGNSISVIGKTDKPASGDTIHVYANWITENAGNIYYHPNVRNGELFNTDEERVTISTKGGTKKYTVVEAETSLIYTQSKASPVTLTGSQFVDMNVYASESAGSGKYHKFCGWVQASSAENAKSANSATYSNGATIPSPGSSALHLYAVWAKNWYTITFNTAGGSVSYTNIYVKKPDSGSAQYPGSVPVPSYTDYLFEGWYIGDEMIYSADGKLNGGSRTLSSDVTLTAHWKPNFYTIHLNYNRPGVASASQTVEDIKIIKTSSETKTLTTGTRYTANGNTYELVGWGSQPTSTEPEYTSISVAQLKNGNDAVTLYGVWKEIITLVFERNAEDSAELLHLVSPSAASGTKSMSSQTIVLGKPTTINSNEFTLNGIKKGGVRNIDCTFAGWAIEPSKVSWETRKGNYKLTYDAPKKYEPNGTIVIKKSGSDFYAYAADGIVSYGKMKVSGGNPVLYATWSK